MRRQPADLAAKSQRSSQLIQAGQFEDAVPIYQDLVRAVPNNPGFLMNFGLALHMAGQNREAIPQFEALSKLDPNLFPANLFVGAGQFCGKLTLQVDQKTRGRPLVKSISIRQVLDVT